MKSAGVTSYYISGIEWTIDREFHYGIENCKYIETLINDTKYLPIKGGEIKFEDDIWDLRPYYTMKKTDDLRFSFKSVPDIFINKAKFFVLLSLLNADNKASSIHRRYSDIKSILKFLDSQNIKSLESVFPNTIKSYMDTKKGNAPQTKKMFYTALEDFFQFLYANYSYNLHVDMQEIAEKKQEYEVIVRKTRNNKKTPNIPSDYFNKLMSLLIKTMRNKKLDYEERAIACVYVILSQTGLRISEILSLETNSLKHTEIKNLDVTAYFLTYKDFKSSDKEQEYILVDIFANVLVKEAFDTLVKLRETRLNKEGNNFIYLPDNNILPATYVISDRKFYDLLYKYADFAKGIESPYPELTVVQNADKPVISPTTKQFRVRVCTELYERGVPLLYIKKYMGHLTDTMMGYYVRPKNKQHKDVEYSNKLLKELVTSDASLLGSDAEQIRANIDKFISNNEFNVENDLDSLIEKLKGKFVIRAKRGGVCVKTSFRECSRDARTNEMFCAYNICPNLFHLYYMADTSYEDFKTLIKTFEYNKDSGFKLQASKELNKLKDVCRRRLIPELDDLKQRIKIKGIDEILQNYPNLSDIIMNFDEIEEDVKLWMKKNF